MLARVAEREGVALSTAAAAAVASSAEGDVRNAVTTLQMLYQPHRGELGGTHAVAVAAAKVWR